MNPEPTSVRILPPEWAPQSALWVGWPRLPEEWGEAFEPARREIAAFVEAAMPSGPVRVAIGDEAAMAHARAALPEAAELVSLPTGDIWLRDTGPVFAVENGRLVAVCFDFNGWGGKFDMPGDRETALSMARHERAEIVRPGAILEGGAIDADGTGRILTTRQCLLNENRNGWSETAAERIVGSALGVSDIVWIERGLEGDHTDGHVDNIARFVAPGHVICQVASSADDPHAERYLQIAARLRDFGFSVTEIPSPGVVLGYGADVLPASHLNFTVTNTSVIVPVFDPGAGAEATRTLEPLFPGRTVIGLSAAAIVSGGGAFHCMTCHVPQVSGRGTG